MLPMQQQQQQQQQPPPLGQQTQGQQQQKAKKKGGVLKTIENQPKPPQQQQQQKPGQHQNVKNEQAKKATVPAQVKTNDVKRELGTIDKTMKFSYGFINCTERNQKLFFHVSQLHGYDIRKLKAGDTVEFEYSFDPNTHKPIATNIKKITGENIFQTPQQNHYQQQQQMYKRNSMTPPRRSPVISPSVHSIASLSSNQTNLNLSDISEMRSSASCHSGFLRAADNLLHTPSSASTDFSDFTASSSVDKELELMKTTASMVEQACAQVEETYIKSCRGIVRSLKDTFGHIEREDCDKEIFFHVTDYNGHISELTVGTHVHFEVRCKSGREAAANIIIDKCTSETFKIENDKFKDLTVEKHQTSVTESIQVTETNEKTHQTTVSSYEHSDNTEVVTIENKPHHHHHQHHERNLPAIAEVQHKHEQELLAEEVKNELNRSFTVPTAEAESSDINEGTPVVVNAAAEQKDDSIGFIDDEQVNEQQPAHVEMKQLVEEWQKSHVEHVQQEQDTVENGQWNQQVQDEVVVAKETEPVQEHVQEQLVMSVENTPVESNENGEWNQQAQEQVVVVEESVQDKPVESVENDESNQQVEGRGSGIGFIVLPYDEEEQVDVQAEAVQVQESTEWQQNPVTEAQVQENVQETVEQVQVVEVVEPVCEQTQETVEIEQQQSVEQKEPVVVESVVEQVEEPAVVFVEAPVQVEQEPQEQQVHETVVAHEHIQKEPVVVENVPEQVESVVETSEEPVVVVAEELVQAVYVEESSTETVVEPEQVQVQEEQEQVEWYVEKPEEPVVFAVEEPVQVQEHMQQVETLVEQFQEPQVVPEQVQVESVVVEEPVVEHVEPVQIEEYLEKIVPKESIVDEQPKTPVEREVVSAFWLDNYFVSLSPKKEQATSDWQKVDIEQVPEEANQNWKNAVASITGGERPVTEEVNYKVIHFDNSAPVDNVFEPVKPEDVYSKDSLDVNQVNVEPINLDQEPNDRLSSYIYFNEPAVETKTESTSSDVFYFNEEPVTTPKEQPQTNEKSFKEEYEEVELSDYVYLKSPKYDEDDQDLVNNHGVKEEVELFYNKKDQFATNSMPMSKSTENIANVTLPNLTDDEPKASERIKMSRSMPSISSFAKSSANDSFIQRTKMRFASLRNHKSEFNINSFVARFKKSPVKQPVVEKVEEEVKVDVQQTNVNNETVNGGRGRKWCNVL